MALAGYGLALAIPAPRCWRRRCGGIVHASASPPPPGDSQRLRILESLGEVSSSLIALSEAMAKASLAVQQLAQAIREDAGVGVESYVSDVGDNRPGIGSDNETTLRLPSQDIQDRNTLSHGLAFRLQQSFLQMRLEGLGKPFELAAEEFVSACIEAHQSSISMEELQLQLILADGALSGVFAIQTDDPKASYLMSEEARLRAAWIRYVYVTISEVNARQNQTAGPRSTATDPEDDETTGLGSNSTVRDDDPSNVFVKQVIKGAVDEGYNLAKLKLEQEYSGPPQSPSVRTLRQSNFLILLAFEIFSRK
ncbi:uncharacterized protein LOC9660233 [Selaginella moellendorffii]|nr:uncharacterized protein LOC9660233 [Selaginella moellendorffii]|eukprot:XP_002964889.2 uncharacterized protein LOC9660233 [Selaginella moellendorffii]